MCEGVCPSAWTCLSITPRTCKWVDDFLIARAAQDLLAARAKIEHQDADGQNGLFGAVQCGNKDAMFWFWVPR